MMLFQLEDELKKATNPAEIARLTKEIEEKREEEKQLELDGWHLEVYHAAIYTW